MYADVVVNAGYMYDCAFLLHGLAVDWLAWNTTCLLVQLDQVLLSTCVVSPRSHAGIGGLGLGLGTWGLACNHLLSHASKHAGKRALRSEEAFCGKSLSLPPLSLLSLSHVHHIVHGVLLYSQRVIKPPHVSHTNAIMTAVDLLNSLAEFGEWAAGRKPVAKKNSALRIGILGAAKIGCVVFADSIRV